MSTIILVFIVGLFLIGALVLFAGLFFDQDLSNEQIEKEQKSLSEIDDPEELVEMAQKYERHNKWNPAVNTWSRYIDLQPEAYDAIFRRGIGYLEMDQHGQAIEDLETVLEELSEPPAQVHLYLGRARKDTGDSLSALSNFQNYLDQHPEDLKASREAANLARELDKPSTARKIYEQLKNQDDQSLYVEGSLSLVEMDLDANTPERAKPQIEELEDLLDQGAITERQEWELLYQKARYFEQEGDQDRADNHYRKIYRENPDFRDVREIVEEQIQSMSEDQLIKKMLRMNRDDFLHYSEEVVELMGYEVMSSDSINPEEVQITAREKAQMMKVNRVIFAFKKWNGKAGELPLKEFELKMLEERFDRGFFICPGGFNHKAEEYAKDSKDMELIGPERLLNYLREAEKQQL